jgi:hypothetical protein
MWNRAPRIEVRTAHVPVRAGVGMRGGDCRRGGGIVVDDDSWCIASPVVLLPWRRGQV